MSISLHLYPSLSVFLSPPRFLSPHISVSQHFIKVITMSLSFIQFEEEFLETREQYEKLQKGKPRFVQSHLIGKNRNVFLEVLISL